MGDVKKDLCRIQLKDLIMTHPKQVIDISNLAQTYFKDMQGDQYLSPIFADWIDQYADGHDPDWFKRPEDKKKHY